MKTEMFKDIAEMNDRFDADCVVNIMDNVDLQKFVEFRTRLLEEKCGDTWGAMEDQNSEDFVNSIIGILVVGMSTLDLMGIDVEKAWSRVIQAQLEDRKPSHLNNHGYLPEIWPANRGSLS